MTSPPRRLFLECTQTHDSKFATGIQRLVGNIVRVCGEVALAKGFSPIPVAFRSGAFVALDRLVERRESKGPGPAQASTLMPDAMREKVARILADSQQRVEFRKGDILLLLDASFFLPLWPAVAEARQKGARVGVVIYDMIPLLHPEFQVQANVEAFGAWLTGAVGHADFLVTISESVRAELLDYTGERSRWEPRTASFRPGADLLSPGDEGEVRREVVDLFETRPTYLVVGTLEPRKNHALALDAFEQLWAAGCNVNLCILGREGWLHENIMARIQRHPELGNRLHALHDADDHELTFAYRQARAVVFPSVAEGFGLPILEAMHLRTPVLASDIPVHREVGGEACRFFGLGESSELSSLVREIEADPEGFAAWKPALPRIPTWKESCRELVERCVKLGAL